ncbi:hypothetical protein ACVIWU_002388 [Bradyrhizobium sp. USDA 4509]|nr:hypothetical protein [Bradyrhizobium sp. USDA 4541]
MTAYLISLALAGSGCHRVVGACMSAEIIQFIQSARIPNASRRTFPRSHFRAVLPDPDPDCDTAPSEYIFLANDFIRRGYRLFEPVSPWAWQHTLYWRKELV